MGKIVKLTESELHGLVEEAVKHVFESQELEEGWMDYFKSIGKDAKQVAQNRYNATADRVKQTAQNVGNKMQQGYNNVKQGYNNVKQGIQNVGNKMQQGIQNAHNRAMDAKAIGDIPNAIKVLDGIKQRGLISGRQLSMVNGAITILNNLLAQSQAR